MRIARAAISFFDTTPLLAYILYMLKIDVKDSFFDREKVLRAMDKGRRRMLGRGGYLTMRSIRDQIRTTKHKSSAPGEPPRQRPGSGFKRSVLYSYDRSTDSVVSGPILDPALRASGYGTKTVPELLEGGGRVTAPETKIIRVRGRTFRIKKGETMTYEPRPFVHSGFEKALKGAEFPEALKRTIKE